NYPVFHRPAAAALLFQLCRDGGERGVIGINAGDQAHALPFAPAGLALNADDAVALRAYRRAFRLVYATGFRGVNQTAVVVFHYASSRSEARIARSACAGSAAWVIGRPITI